MTVPTEVLLLVSPLASTFNLLENSVHFGTPITLVHLLYPHTSCWLLTLLLTFGFSFSSSAFLTRALASALRSVQPFIFFEASSQQLSISIGHQHKIGVLCVVCCVLCVVCCVLCVVCCVLCVVCCVLCAQFRDTPSHTPEFVGIGLHLMLRVSAALYPAPECDPCEEVRRKAYPKRKTVPWDVKRAQDQKIEVKGIQGRK